MLDIHLIRKDQESLANAIAVRGDRPDFSKVLELDEKRRQHIASSESMRQELNAASKAIGLKKRDGEDASAEMEATHNIKAKIAVEADSLASIETELQDKLLRFPNCPLKDVPAGADEASNVEVGKWGSVPQFDFTPKAHDDLGKALGVMDSEAGVALAKSRFTLLRSGGGSPRAGSHQLHAQQPRREGLRRGFTALHGQLKNPHRNGPTAQILRRSLSPRGRRPLLDPNG